MKGAWPLDQRVTWASEQEADAGTRKQKGSASPTITRRARRTSPARGWQAGMGIPRSISWRSAAPARAGWTAPGPGARRRPAVAPAGEAARHGPSAGRLRRPQPASTSGRCRCRGPGTGRRPPPATRRWRAGARASASPHKEPRPERVRRRGDRVGDEVDATRRPPGWRTCTRQLLCTGEDNSRRNGPSSRGPKPPWR